MLPKFKVYKKSTNSSQIFIWKSACMSELFIECSLSCKLIKIVSVNYFKFNRIFVFQEISFFDAPSRLNKKEHQSLMSCADLAI